MVLRDDNELILTLIDKGDFSNCPKELPKETGMPFFWAMESRH